MNSTSLPPLAHWLAWWRSEGDLVHDSVEAYVEARRVREAEYAAVAHAVAPLPAGPPVAEPPA